MLYGDLSYATVFGRSVTDVRFWDVVVKSEGEYAINISCVV